MNKNEIINRLEFRMKEGQLHYNSYLINHHYIFAKALFQTNQEIAFLIDELSVYLKEGEKRNTILEWSAHLDIWMLQFEELESELYPKSEDEFIFQRIDGSLAFPKRVESVLEELKKSE